MAIRMLFHPRAIACMILILCLVATVILPDSSAAQRRHFKEEWLGVLPDFYPKGFDGYGRIDRINQQEVVIDDIFFKLATDVSFSTPRRKKATSYAFEAGRLVGYILNDRREIKSLWFIK